MTTTTTEHQPREHPVTCRWCFRTQTYAPDAICENCTPKAS